MDDGNKKQRHQFLNYLEDYQEIGQEKEAQEKEEQDWVRESNEKQQHKQKFSIWIFVLLTFFLLIIIAYWWNISRDKFYQAMNKPLTDNKFQEFLLLVDDAKNSSSEGDWQSEFNSIDDSDFTDEEKAIFDDLKQKVNEGAKLENLINDLK